MKNLRIQFTHPVQGRIQLRKKPAGDKIEMFDFASDNDFIVDICTLSLTQGNWTASVEWEHDSQPYFLERHFIIVDEECVH